VQEDGEMQVALNLAQDSSSGTFDWGAALPGLLATLAALVALIRTMVERAASRSSVPGSSGKLPVVSMVGESLPVTDPSTLQAAGIKALLVGSGYILVGLTAAASYRLDFLPFDSTLVSLANGLLIVLMGYMVSFNAFGAFSDSHWETTFVVDATNDREVIAECIASLNQRQAVLVGVEDKNSSLLARTRRPLSFLSAFNVAQFFIPEPNRRWVEQIEIHITGVDKSRFQVRVASSTLTPTRIRGNERNVRELVRSLVA
jgi:hypothetical protein